MSQDHEETKETNTSVDELPDEGQNALSALRSVWGATGQTSKDLEEEQEDACESPRCKNMDSVGFGAMADQLEPTGNTHQAAENLRSVWKRQLEREGKLDYDAQSLKDVVAKSGGEAAKE